MMKHLIGKRIADLWKGLLSQKEKDRLLEDLEIQETEIRQALEKSFFEEVNQYNTELLSDREYDTILDHVHIKMGLPDKKPRRLITYWSAAAAILVLLGVSFITVNYLQPRTTFPQLAQAVQSTQDTIKLYNTTAKDRIAHLKDGSIITLSPGSELAFAQDYGKSDRILHLKGKAKFTVAHDATRPFVVWTDQYSTTALGTVFTVDARTDNRIDIDLLSGKIVVKTTGNSTLVMKDQYLLAGDKLIIDRIKGTVELKTAKVKQVIIPKDNNVPDLIEQVSPLHFKDATLQTVFDTIAQHKQIEIDTHHLKLDGLTFSGEFEESESALMMVRVICQMNNLDVEEVEGRIIIRQKILINQIIPTGIKNQTTN